jgi:putative heme iron utilization protein
MRIILLLAAGCVSVSGGSPTWAGPVGVCATGDEVARITPLLAKGPLGPTTTAMAGRELALPEALVASALPRDQAVGVAGSHFAELWNSLTAWPEALFLLQKSGNVFEVRSPVRPGKPSTRSKFFNIEGEGVGLGGHLRPVLISAIYGYAFPGKEATIRGVMFFDDRGEAAFGAFVGGEGRDATPDELAKWNATWALLRSLPRLCDAPRAIGAAP